MGLPLYMRIVLLVLSLINDQRMTQIKDGTHLNYHQHHSRKDKTVAKRKQITLKFQADEKNFDAQLENIKDLFKSHNLMQLEYGDINFSGLSVKIDKLVSGGPM
jgi:translation initiation factor IF-3